MPAPTTAAKILDAAYALLDREGPAALSMRRVAEAVGITPMAIYRHYPNREALLEAVAERIFSVVAADWSRRSREPDLRARLMALLEPHLDFALRHPHLFDLAFASRRAGARRYPDDFRAGRSPTVNVVVETLDEGMRNGVLRDDDPHAVMMSLTGLQHGLIALYRAGRFSYDETAFRAFYLQAMQRMIDGLATRPCAAEPQAGRAR
jgi:AcrR family transcriptional regulator